jgi:hypothetical protein
VSDEALTEFLAKPPNPSGLKGGGGNGTFSPMEARAAQLETDMREVKANTRMIGDTLLRIEGKLDTRAAAIDLAEIKGKLDSKASAADVGSLSGKLNDKPDTWKVVTIVLALGAIMAGSQIVKTIADVIHPPVQQAVKSP